MSTELDISYIAGLFDGEGCVQCKQRMEPRKSIKDLELEEQKYGELLLKCL